MTGASLELPDEECDGTGGRTDAVGSATLGVERRGLTRSSGRLPGSSSWLQGSRQPRAAQPPSFLLR